MIEERQEYPLHQCETCFHNGVCTFIEVFNEIAELTPIVLDNAGCQEYAEITILEGNDITKEKIDDALGNNAPILDGAKLIQCLDKQLDEISFSARPTAIVAHTKTLEVMSRYLHENVNWNNVSGNIVCYHDIPVRPSDALPVGFIAIELRRY